jgi:glycosyltransferase involved in cell wall biosynthesis
MKVLVIHNSYQQPGGEDVVFAQECQLLRRCGHQVVTYERTNRELERMSSFERLVAAKNMVSAKGSRQDIRDLLGAERPDVVHAHNTFMMVSPSVYEVCQEMHVPVVQTLHNFRLLCPAWSLFRDGHVCEECPTSGLWRSVWHGCYHNSRATTAGVALMLQVHRLANTWNDSVDSYVALSEFARQKFIDGGLPPGKLQVKPNFVYPDPGERDCAGEYALYVGRLSPEKGVATLLAAWEMLATSIPLLIVGDGPLRTQLERECSEKNLPAVKFTGRLTGTETRDVIKRAAFLMVPSLWYECFPMTICEAFACGTPVLCSRLGGMQEIVTDNHTGMHFVPGDAVDLAEKVEWAWHNPARIAGMGKEARRDYESFYTAEHNYERLMQIYRETLGLQARN